MSDQFACKVTKILWGLMTENVQSRATESVAALNEALAGQAEAVVLFKGQLHLVGTHYMMMVPTGQTLSKAKLMLELFLARLFLDVNRDGIETTARKLFCDDTLLASPRLIEQMLKKRIERH